MIGCTTCTILIPDVLFARIDAQILGVCFPLLPHENVPVSSWSVWHCYPNKGDALPCFRDN